MQLKTVRELVYGGPICKGKRYQYFVYLDGARIGNGATKDEAEDNSKRELSHAFEYIARASEVRTATDGTILIFRQLSHDTAMYEFSRGNGASRSACLGRMTDPTGATFKTLSEYADHIASRYDAG
jgi:hypothetical protein